MRRPILVSLVAGALACVGLYAWSHDSSARSLGDPEAAAQRRELQTLALQVDALDARLRELGRAPPQASTVAASRAPASAQARVIEPAPLEGVPAVQEAAMQAAMLDLEAEFAREPASGTARDAESELATRLTEVMPQGSHIEQIECRAGLCRVESSHRGVEGYREFLRATTRRASDVWRGSVRYEALPLPDREGDDVVLVAYVSR
ncbi:MAG TPA: hypothetical protein VFZ61_05285 [Polyangiales bacterium]